jgi:hypothetical protein
VVLASQHFQRMIRNEDPQPYIVWPCLRAAECLSVPANVFRFVVMASGTLVGHGVYCCCLSVEAKEVFGRLDYPHWRGTQLVKATPTDEQTYEHLSIIANLDMSMYSVTSSKPPILFFLLLSLLLM